MFRLRTYTINDDNSLKRRLKHLNNDEIICDKIKFWDIKRKTWIDDNDLNGYKIQKEIQIDNELIFYIYSEDYNAKD